MKGKVFCQKEETWKVQKEERQKVFIFTKNSSFNKNSDGISKMFTFKIILPIRHHSEKKYFWDHNKRKQIKMKEWNDANKKS